MQISHEEAGLTISLQAGLAVARPIGVLYYLSPRYDVRVACRQAERQKMCHLHSQSPPVAQMGLVLPLRNLLVFIIAIDIRPTESLMYELVNHSPTTANGPVSVRSGGQASITVPFDAVKVRYVLRR